MSIIRRKHNSGWTAIPREPFENEALSWEARGLLAYLLVKPDDWQVMVSNLVGAGNYGRNKIYAMLAELEAAGHIDRAKVRGEDGRLAGYEYTVFDIPEPCPPSRDTVSRDTVKRTLLNTKTSTNTKKDPAAPTSGARRWDGFYSVVAADVAGDSDAWRQRRDREKALADYGRLAGMFGRACKDDLHAACSTWRRYAEARGEYLPRNMRTLLNDAGRWLSENPVTVGGLKLEGHF